MAAVDSSSREKTHKTSRIFNRHRSENEEETVHLDINKDDSDNAYDILRNMCQKQVFTDTKILAFVNAFIKLIDKINKSKGLLAISKRDILCCLRVPLVSNNSAVRSAALRAIRHCINQAVDVTFLNKLQIPHLIARSIDLVLKNDHERIQALRLSIKLLKMNPKHFSPIITRALVSLANSINENKDRLIISSLSIICQICVLNPDLVLECCGEMCLLRCCVEISSSRVNECLVGCLLFLLNKSNTRLKTNIQLDYILNVFCDLQRKKFNPQDGTINSIVCSRLSLLAALRTWPGILYLCNPANSSGIRAIINILYLNAPDLKKEILYLFCEAVGLDGDVECFKDIPTALAFIDPGRAQEGWRIHEGFILSEGKDLLPLKSDTRPNLTEVHMALLVYTFLECGLLPALVEVICSDVNISTQAVILLGFLLHLSNRLLPSELLELSSTLPMLLHYATNGLPFQRTQAVVAISVLHKVHRILSRPVPLHSLFLKKLYIQGKCDKTVKSAATKTVIIKNIDDHIKEAEVFYHRDPRHWNWIHIKAILKCRMESFLRLEDIQHRTTLRKIVHFFKPSSSQFSAIQYSHKDKSNDIYTTAGFLLFDFLLDSQQEEAQKLLEEILGDITQQLECLVTGVSVHECFSPHLLSTTLSQYYFLLIGHLSCSSKGLVALEKYHVIDILHRIIDSTHHDIYIKLIISCLNYSKSSCTRSILGKALTSSLFSVRQYATDLLLIMARANLPMFHKWGLDLLLGQIYDENKIVANAAIDVLHELCYDSVYMDALIDMRPSLLHLGDKGHLLLIRFLGKLCGFNFLADASFLSKELLTWEKDFNFRYVGLVESQLHDALTLHQRTDSGRYCRRLTNAKHKWKQVLIPPHLYGELAKHEEGMNLLLKQSVVHKMVQIVQSGRCETDDEILELKSSLWGLSNVGTSELGLKFLQQFHVIHHLIEIAHSCSVLAVRATAFYCISLIATMEEGANALNEFDWVAVRRNRKEYWSLEKTDHLIAYTEQPLQYIDDKESSCSAHSLDNSCVSDSAERGDFSSLNITYPPLVVSKHRATTLPPGFSCSFDYIKEMREVSSPPACRRGHQRSYSETSSLNTGLSVATQRLSFQDAAGLAKLQNIRSNVRPEFSYKLFNELDNLARRPHILDQSSCSLPSNGSTTKDDGEDESGECISPLQPVYIGICLPRALAQYLSLTNSFAMDKREERRRKRGSVSFSEMEQVKELVEDENLSITESSLSEDDNDDDSKEVEKKPRHDGTQCIACCCRVPRTRRHRKISTSSFRYRTDTESSYGNAPEGSPISLQWRIKAASEGGSAESFFLGEGDTFTLPTTSSLRLPPAALSQTRVRRDVLKHVQRMCNPVWTKASRQSLLQMKQSHPSVFQDVCLYSSACNILAHSSCRVSARRFVQELFLDLVFVQIYDDAMAALTAYAPAPIPDATSSHFKPLPSSNIDSGNTIAESLIEIDKMSPKLCNVPENMAQLSVSTKKPVSPEDSSRIPTSSTPH